MTSENLLIGRTPEKMSHRKEMIRGKRIWEPLQIEEGSTFPGCEKTVSASVPEGTGMKTGRSVCFSLWPPVSGWRVEKWLARTRQIPN